jgi:hypothetical protein
MKKIFKLLGNLLFNVDFSGAVDEAFNDYARMCGDKSVTESQLKTENHSVKTEIKKTHCVTYIYDTHATIVELSVSIEENVINLKI